MVTSRNVAVAIVNYNSGEMLLRCLESLYAQTISPTMVIVVDNASADGSAVLAERRFPGACYFYSKTNLGFAAGNNVAIHLAKDAMWIASLNPDAWADSRWLETMISTANEQSEYSFFASRMLMASDPLRIDGAGDIYHLSGSAWRRAHGHLNDDQMREPMEVFGPCAAAALYRRSALIEVGAFDERYFCYFEDVDLSFRLRLRGHRCLYVPEALVYHEGSAITGRRSDFTVYHGYRNLVWTYVKNMPNHLFLRGLPQLLAYLAAAFVYFALRGQVRAIARALRDAIWRLPEMWRSRVVLQREARATKESLSRVITRGVLAPYLRGRA